DLHFWDPSDAHLLSWRIVRSGKPDPLFRTMRCSSTGLTVIWAKCCPFATPCRRKLDFCGALRRRDVLDRALASGGAAARALEGGCRGAAEMGGEAPADL